MCKSRCFRQNIDLSRLHIILLAFYALLFLQVFLSAAIATLPSGSPTAPARARARTDRGVVDLRTGPADCRIGCAGRPVFLLWSVVVRMPAGKEEEEARLKRPRL